MAAPGHSPRLQTIITTELLCHKMLERLTSYISKQGNLDFWGYHNLGLDYDFGTLTAVEIDKKKAHHFYTLAAIMGNMRSRYNLGRLDLNEGNHQRATKHFLIAARAGHDKSLGLVKDGFMGGHITKDEYEDSLRAFHKQTCETKSDKRDAAARRIEEYNRDRGT